MYENSLPTVIQDKKQRTRVNIAALSGIFLTSIVNAMIGPAVPAMLGNLGKSDLYPMSWTIFFLLVTVVIPIGGKLSDLFGKKLLFTLGLVFFILGMASCGLSRSMEMFVASRGIMGIGFAMIFGTVLALIGEINPPKEKGKWFGVFGTLLGAASAAFPFVGGLIVQNIGWRWVFLLTVPFGLIILLFFIRVMPKYVMSTKPEIDYLGALFLTATSTSLVLSLNGGISQISWATPINLGGFAVVTLVIFLIVESKTPEPMIPLELFKYPVFIMAAIGVFFVTAGLYPVNVYLPFFGPGLKGLSASSNGLLLSIMPGASALSSLVFGILVAKTGKLKELTIGCLMVMALGLFGMSQANASTSSALFVVYLIAVGVGSTPAFIAFTMAVQGALPVSKLGTATGAISFFQNIGGTVGVILASAVFSNKWMDGVGSAVPPQLQHGLPAEKLNGLLNPQLLMDSAAIQKTLALMPAELQVAFEALVMGLKRVMTNSLQSVWLLLGAAVVLSIFATFFLKPSVQSDSSERR